MSTKQRYGDAVLKAIQDITSHKVGESGVYVGVGQVAKKAGVSKPTAKKYLIMLWEMMYVKIVIIDGVMGYRAEVAGR